MITGNEPAFGSKLYPSNEGLTIRQHFAAMAMQAMLSSTYARDYADFDKNFFNSIATHADKAATALINQLNKEA